MLASIVFTAGLIKSLRCVSHCVKQHKLIFKLTVFTHLHNYTYSLPCHFQIGDHLVITVTSTFYKIEQSVSVRVFTSMTTSLIFTLGCLIQYRSLHLLKCIISSFMHSILCLLFGRHHYVSFSAKFLNEKICMYGYS